MGLLWERQNFSILFNIIDFKLRLAMLRSSLYTHVRTTGRILRHFTVIDLRSRLCT